MTNPKKNDSVVCYVALGSNLDDPRKHIRNGIKALENHPDIHCLKTSRFYLSKPHGPQDQLDYINGAVTFETVLEPEALLDELQKIENDNGRVRENVERWGSRTLDLDLLLYGDAIIETNRLTVPHPRICERAFVLYPMRDLVATSDQESLKISDNTSLNDCIANLPTKDRNEISETEL